MKLYKFTAPYYKSEIGVSELDADELSHVYAVTHPERISKGRVCKSNIGIVGNGNELYLLENNEKLAMSIFLEKFNADLEKENCRHEENMARLTQKIKELEEAINE